MPRSVKPKKNKNKHYKDKRKERVINWKKILKNNKTKVQ